jgi:hypothetical protein
MKSAAAGDNWCSMALRVERYGGDGTTVPYGEIFDDIRNNSGFVDTRGRPDVAANIPEGAASPALKGELAGRSSVPRAAAVARRTLLCNKAQDPHRGRHWHLARVYIGPNGGGALCANARPPRTWATHKQHAAPVHSMVLCHLDLPPRSMRGRGCPARCLPASWAPALSWSLACGFSPANLVGYRARQHGGRILWVGANADYDTLLVAMARPPRRRFAAYVGTVAAVFPDRPSA